MSRGDVDPAARAAATTSSEFTLRPPPPRGVALTLLLLVVVLSLPTVLVLRAGGLASLGILGAWAITLGVVIASVRAARRATVRVTREGVEVRAPLVGERLRWDALRVDEARVADPAAEPGLRPRWKEMGVGLFGYASGWFTLRDGRSALAVVASGAPIVHVPWRTRSALVLTPHDAEGLLASLREHATRD